jgi:hypothetical protein
VISVNLLSEVQAMIKESWCRIGYLTILMLGLKIFATAQSHSNEIVPLDNSSSTWNTQTAFFMAQAELAQISWSDKPFFCSSEACTPIHGIFGVFPISHPDHDLRLLVTTSIEEGRECRACAPYVSVFEFDLIDGAWNIIRSDIAIFRSGTWGQVRTDGIEVQLFGEDLYGFVLRGGTCTQGICQEQAEFWIRVHGQFKSVLEIETSESVPTPAWWDYGILETDWNSTIQFVRGASSLKDIRVEREGVRLVEHDHLLYRDIFREHENFRFDGSKYVSDGIIQTHGMIPGAKGAFEDQNAEAMKQKYSVEVNVIQNGVRISSQDGIFYLNSGDFIFEIISENISGVLLEATTSEWLYKTEMRKAYRIFLATTAMAESMFNEERELFLGEPEYPVPTSYWYYDDPDDHRFDETPVGDRMRWVGHRTVSFFYDPEEATRTPLSDFQGSIFVGFYSQNNANLKENDLAKISMWFMAELQFR